MNLAGLQIEHFHDIRFLIEKQFSNGLFMGIVNIKFIVCGFNFHTTWKSKLHFTDLITLFWFYFSNCFMYSKTLLDTWSVRERKSKQIWLIGNLIHFCNLILNYFCTFFRDTIQKLTEVPQSNHEHVATYVQFPFIAFQSPISLFNFINFSKGLKLISKFDIQSNASSAFVCC